jgi:hypothetical protein
MADSQDLTTLVISLDARMDKASKEMAKFNGIVEKNLRSVESRFARAEGVIARFGSSFSRGIGLIGGGFAGLAGLRAFGSAIDKIAQIGEIAGRIGVTTRALQAMHQMALQTGASVDQVDKALQSLAEQSAQKGSFLDKLFSANNLKVSDTDTEANLRHFMDLMKNATSESQRLFIATQVFGDKVGRELVEAFSQGGAALDATFSKLTSSGHAFTDAQIKEAHDIRDEFRTVANDIETTWEKMALTMIHALQKVGDALAPYILKFLDLMPPDIAAPARRGIPLTPKELSAVPKASNGPGGGFVDRVIGAESSGNPNAENPLSTATGLGQFIESTWIEQFKKVFPSQAQTMSREAILAMRTDAATSRALIENYAKENAAVLQKAGVSVNDAALYLAHFLGPAGAVSVLKAAAGTPLSSLLSPAQIAANQRLLGGGQTAGGLISSVQSRFPGGSVGILPAFGPGAGLSGAAVPGGAAAPVGSAGTTLLPPTAEELKKLADNIDVARDAMKGFFSDMISGLRAGQSLTETLGNAFENLSTKLADKALSGIVDLLLGAQGSPSGGILGGLLGFGAPAARAEGGPVSPGHAYVVGEKRPELFVPSMPGHIVPSLDARSSSGDGSAPRFVVEARPNPYFDIRVRQISGHGDARTLDAARRAYPGTAARFAKLGTTNR